MSETTLYDYARILHRRRGMLGLTTASAVVVALVSSLLLPNVYEARSEFYVVQDTKTTGPASTTGGRVSEYTIPLVVQELEKWYLGLLKSEAVRRLVSESVQGITAQALASSVDIEFTRQHIGRVRARDGDPKRAAEIANAYPPALSAFLTDTGNGRRQLSLDAIDKSLREIDVDLEKTHKRLRALLAEKNSPSMTGELQVLAERKATYERELDAAKVQLEGIEKKVAITMEQLSAESQLGAGLQGSLFSTSVQRYLSEIASLETELAAVRAEFDGPRGERNPKVRTISARLAQQQLALDRELENIGRAQAREPAGLHEQLRKELAALHKDRASVRAEAAAKAAALKRLLTRVDTDQDYSLREQEIRTEIGRIEKQRDGLRQRWQESLIQAAAEALPVIMVQTAEPPEEPKFPVALFNVLVAALLGIFAGIYVAFAYDYVTRARGQIR